MVSYSYRKLGLFFRMPIQLYVCYITLHLQMNHGSSVLAVNKIMGHFILIHLNTTLIPERSVIFVLLCGSLWIN